MNTENINPLMGAIINAHSKLVKENVEREKNTILKDYKKIQNYTKQTFKCPFLIYSYNH